MSVRNDRALARANELNARNDLMLERVNELNATLVEALDKIAETHALLLREPRLLIRRSAVPDCPPRPGSLKPGELAVEMANPLRLWVGVPEDIDPTGMRLLIELVEDAS